MTKTTAFCALLIGLGVVVVASLARPDLLSDNNPFLKNFINHELLAVLGVIVAITLASTSEIHLTFNRMEERVGKPFLMKTRAGVKQAAIALIILFIASVVVVTSKAWIIGGPASESFWNGIALLLLLWSILILLSITQLVFAIPPMFDAKDKQ